MYLKPEIMDMNCAPDPQWLKDFKQEIRMEFGLSIDDINSIAAKVAKIVRKRDQEVCRWIDRLHQPMDVQENIILAKTMVEKFKNEMKEYDHQ